MDAPHKDASVARAFDLPPGASCFYKLGHASRMPAPAGDSRGDVEPELTAAAAGPPRIIPPGPPSPALARNFSLLAAAAGSKVTLRT